MDLPHPMYRMYRFYDARGVLLYVGQTGRLPWKRLLEHVCAQPWADRMARWEVDPRAFARLDDVLAAERAAIRTERPAYNWVHNERNPRRRWAGPARSARTPVDFGRRRWTPRRTRPRRAIGLGRRPGRAKAAGLVATGLIIAAGSAWAARPLPVTGEGRLLIGAVAGAAAVAWLCGTTARYRRRLLRRAATLSVALLAAYVAWQILPALAG